MPTFENLKKTDKEVYDAIEKELQRERNKIELIASENLVSKYVCAKINRSRLYLKAQDHAAAHHLSHNLRNGTHHFMSTAHTVSSL